MNKSYLNIISAQDLRDNSHPHIFFFGLNFYGTPVESTGPTYVKFSVFISLMKKMIAS